MENPTVDHAPSSTTARYTLSGVTPVKPQYLLTSEVRIPNTGPDGIVGVTRGQNHKRPHENVDDAVSLCVQVALGRICPFGNTCKFNHDVDEYLQTKPEDIGTQCPLESASENGRCYFGLRCRFAKSHVRSFGESETIKNEGEFRGLIEKIRKKKVDFPRANAYLKTLRPRNSEKNTKEVAGLCLDPTISTETQFDSTPYPTIERHQSLDFKDKLYLAPLTTVGNLPFRRLCKTLGADITCSEMALCTQLLKGSPNEWALLKRHESEDCFGVQLCGGWSDSMCRAAELVTEEVRPDFIDINMGCPIDMVYKKGMGCGLMAKAGRLEEILCGLHAVLKSVDIPLTVKIRTGILDGKNIAHKLVPRFHKLDVAAVTIHGRSREQRYTKEADWTYIDQCALENPNIPIIGNGDILSFEDYEKRLAETSVTTVMLGRGPLIKPWLFTEIKEQRHWDISSTERFGLLKNYVRFGMEHFGTDTTGINKTRRFLLEWMSFLCRYVPVGIMERMPPKINDRPPRFCGRDQLETLMASDSVQDWIKISEVLLGPVPLDFKFVPKHKANSYGSLAENG